LELLEGVGGGEGGDAAGEEVLLEITAEAAVAEFDDEPGEGVEGVEAGRRGGVGQAGAELRDGAEAEAGGADGGSDRRGAVCVMSLTPVLSRGERGWLRR